jgi:pimeloyl-ACP methyl ester carboxylesterase
MGDVERLPLLDGVQRSDYQAIIRSVFHKPRKADRGLLNYYKRCFESRKWKLGLIRTVKGTNDHVVRHRMKQIQAPTLLIGGKEDQIVDYLEGERAAVEMPNGHWLSLPNCGHAPQIEMARLVNRLVVHFLTSSKPCAQPSFVKLLLNKPSRVLT